MKMLLSIVLVFMMLSCKKEEHFQSMLYIHPNPADDKIELHVSKGTDAPVKISIPGTNINVFASGYVFQTEINIVGLPSGTYQIEIVEDNELVNSSFFHKR